MALKSAVRGWREWVLTLRQECWVEQLKEENLGFKAESDKLMRRTMSMMIGGQSSLAVMSAVTGLGESLGTLRQERLREQLKEENLRYQAKSDESMRRAMSRIVGGQASLVVREAFTG